MGFGSCSASRSNTCMLVSSSRLVAPTGAPPEQESMQPRGGPWLLQHARHRWGGPLHQTHDQPERRLVSWQQRQLTSLKAASRRWALQDIERQCTKMTSRATDPHRSFVGTGSLFVVVGIVLSHRGTDAGQVRQVRRFRMRTILHHRRCNKDDHPAMSVLRTSAADNWVITDTIGTRPAGELSLRLAVPASYELECIKS